MVKGEGKTRTLIWMGGHFDVARPRLVQTEPASDERDHPRCGQVDEYPELPHDRLITYLPPKRFVGCMELTLSDLYLPA